MKIGVVSLLLSASALALAVFALTRESPRPERASTRTDRVVALEAKVAELKRQVEALKAERPGAVVRDAFGLPTEPPKEGGGETEAPSRVAEGEKDLTAVVDAAVDRKTKQVLEKLRRKANKKPPFDDFAKVLELTDEQRAAAGRVIVDGQKKVHAILNIPTADGTNLMDQLVELVARGYAEPGKDHGWGPWFWRVMGEKIPGTDETYGARIESVKATMRATFKRDWTEAQYKEFEEWALDPTEVQNVPGSPNEALGKRIADLARRLGADIPDEKQR